MEHEDKATLNGKFEIEKVTLNGKLEIEAETQHHSVGGYAFLLLVLGILVFLFHGSPDVHDLVKALLTKWSQ